MKGGRTFLSAWRVGKPALLCKIKSDIQRRLKENYLSEKTSAPNSPNCTWAIAARQSDREGIFIRAIGLVNQDIAMAHHIYRRAAETGVGTRLPY